MPADKGILWKVSENFVNSEWNKHAVWTVSIFLLKFPKITNLFCTVIKILLGLTVLFGNILKINNSGKFFQKLVPVQNYYCCGD